MRPFSAALGLILLAALAGHACAEAGKPDAKPNFDQVGILSTGKVTIGGETTGITLKTAHGSFELSMFGELARKAQGLDGKKVHVIGTLSIVAGVEIKERRVVAVESFSEVKPDTDQPFIFQIH